MVSASKWEDNGQEIALFSFFPFAADLVDGQRRARLHFGGLSKDNGHGKRLFEFGLASERENGGRRRRNRRRKEIKGKHDNRLVSDVI